VYILPANRSRTAQWRRCLRQIHERRGAIEIAVVSPGEDNPRHLVWRVRLLDLTDAEMVVEQPSSLGQLIPIRPNTELLAMISVGQNRWMFTTTNLGFTEVGSGHRAIKAMRMEMPTTVERCQRRTHARVRTSMLTLPNVEIWPLLDPKSVLPAERANELRAAGQSPSDGVGDDLMPEVGPRFNATLLNLGGGGVGLRVNPNDSQIMLRHKLFWIRLDLAPDLDTPICASAKLAHTHMESSQHTYAGLAFDFTFNPGHQKLVVEQICKYITVQQTDVRRSA
jgi:hypothetical protein